MGRPNFLRNNEEWIVWLLAGELGGSSTPETLSGITALPMDQLHDNLLYLERVRILSLERDTARHYPFEIGRVILTGEGVKMSDELNSRPDPGDDLF